MSLDYSNNDETRADDIVQIPWGELSEEALDGVIQAHLISELADHTVENFDIDAQMKNVKVGLAHGDWVLVFDGGTQSCRLFRRTDFDELVKGRVLL